jgi:hypothetical protein
MIKKTLSFSATFSEKYQNLSKKAKYRKNASIKIDEFIQMSSFQLQNRRGSPKTVI